MRAVRAAYMKQWVAWANSSGKFENTDGDGRPKWSLRTLLGCRVPFVPKS